MRGRAINSADFPTARRAHQLLEAGKKVARIGLRASDQPLKGFDEPANIIVAIRSICRLRCRFERSRVRCWLFCAAGGATSLSPRQLASKAERPSNNFCSLRLRSGVAGPPAPPRSELFNKRALLVIPQRREAATGNAGVCSRRGFFRTPKKKRWLKNLPSKS